MRFADYLAELLDFGQRDGDGNITLDKGLSTAAKARLDVEEIALFSTIDLIASTAATCEWRTYQAGKRCRAEDWYRFNIEPNQNTSAVVFKRMLFARLLRFNEALVFQRPDGFYLADSFAREVFAFRQNQYSAITCNNLTLNRTLREEEVFYFHLANQDAANLLHGLHGLYAEAMAEAMDKYKHSGGRSGILKISTAARASKTFEADVDRIMQQRFKMFFESKNAVLPLFEGYDYTPQDGAMNQKANGEVADMESIMRQAQDRSCNAYHVPPALLRGDVTNQSEAVRSLLTFGVRPPLLTVQNEINRKLYGRETVNGWEIKIDASKIRAVDVFEIAEKADKLIQDSVYNTNELREKIGEDPIPEKWADQYNRTKNMEAVEPSKGGDKG